MNGINFVPVLLAVGGVLALICGRNDRASSTAGWSSCVVSLSAMLLFSLFALCSEHSQGIALRAWFRIPVCLVGIAAALHAPGYLKDHAEKRLGVFWFFFNMTLSSMALVTMAQGKGAFLFAWEMMGLFSFALVAFEWRSGASLKASWIYLLACEAGGLLLIALLAYGGKIHPAAGMILVLLAFGLKAGFPMLHVWLPEAHPAAPAPVSAVMSAAMIPLGFFGIFLFIPRNVSPVWLGWILLFLGMGGAFFGILFGLAQKDLKKMLAYSSIENIGIVSLGFGLGFLGSASGCVMMAACGFSGAFLHILNHAFLKGTLFLGAGSVFKSVHTLNMDLMGGLIRKNPYTGAVFTAASLGISGLPPFCGFTGELLIYMAAFSGVSGAKGAVFAGSFASGVVLALTGGLACATFCKAVGAVFLGSPRTKEAEEAYQEEFRMFFPMFLLFLPSLALPLAAPWIVSGWILPMAGAEYASCADFIFSVLFKSGLFCVFATLLLLIFLWARARLPRGEENFVRGVWDCGYVRPTARMAYTGTAFSQPLVDWFNGLLRQHKTVRRPEKLFPEKASIDVETDDFGDRLLWRNLFRFFGKMADRIHFLQSGYLHLYILVMVLALLAMLAWGFVFSGGGYDGDPHSARVRSAVWMTVKK